MDDNLLVAHKWVRILADNSADGVWDIEGCGCCADDLPIPAALIDRIRAWQTWYDRDENGWTVVYFDEPAGAGAAKVADREVLNMRFEV